ncbi:MAG: dihydroxyacetone kinase subunit DhaK [Anaerolineae bacterium]|nr:dihydroxyacetone kinase subunit DhaK [Anaerolineae bacterium]NIN98005.1 dihydroxyacetone kinase subunit DhaK [Anaerolineae bacterium]NIQ80950.1 dihydroxyacetone kinase subunit DhaK [Anaerolineae bacterium]
MKKLINKPADVVRESLQGMAAAHADLIKVSYDPIFVYRADAPVEGKVAVISGGGSGHEPTHVGFVGPGMLDAACPGDVFVSPTTEQIFEAIRVVQGGAGVLNVVKCYWDDMDVFAEAAELAHREGIPVANILIDDDVAVSESVYSHGRRGTGTTVLAEKICGAAAELGYDLPKLADLCRRVNLNGRTMGIAFTPSTVPAKGTPSFEIGENEMEVGIGIHGEPGRERMSLKTADEITEMLALEIIDDPAYERTVREFDSAKGEWVDVDLVDPPLQPEDQVLAFVNGMGGTPIPELYIVYRKLEEICQEKGLTIVRDLIGTYITAIEMQGASITLLRMDDEMLSLWDAPVNTPRLRWGA